MQKFIFAEEEIEK